MEDEHPDHLLSDPLIISDVIKEEITQTLREEPHEIELTVSAKDWSIAAMALQSYRNSFEFWDGFLNLGELKNFQIISTKSRTLLDTIGTVSDECMSLVLKDELGEDGLKKISFLLEKLSSMEVKTPKSELGRKQYSERHLGRPKAVLQVQIDDWWRRVTRLEPRVFEEPYSSPYSLFLAKLFLALPARAQAGLGASRTAVEERRRVAKRRKKMLKYLASELQGLEK